MKISLNERKYKALKDSLDGKVKAIQKELAVVINKTAKQGERVLAKEVHAELATTIKAIQDKIKIRGRATKENPTSKIALSKSDRLSLRVFSPRETKAGVTYRISKTKGRKTAKSAFEVKKLSKHIWKRKGKSKFPIVKLQGPSPWGVAVVNDMQKPASEKIQRELTKQINRRVDFILKKKTGVIP